MTTLADRYELQELLGSGGMAHVYAALDHRLGRRVAVKLVRADLVADGSSRKRLLREARSAASFHHPNSVAVYDTGEEQQQPFIVMELVDGESLVDRLQRERRLDPTEAARIGVGVLAALEAAHAGGLVHRDIKPGNVLLPRSGGVKLADFGIAKAVADTAIGLTNPGDVMGTPKYLSPEQVAGHPAVPASDQYSLGIVLYECLVGKAPFTAENPMAVALAHQRQPVPSVRRAARDVPTELAHVVEQALAKDPADRFADAAAMRRALEAAVNAAGLAAAAGGAAANATTTALASDDSTSGRSAASPATAPGSAQRTTDSPPQNPPRSRGRSKRLGTLVVVLVVVLGAALALAFLQSDRVEEDPDDSVDEPVEEPFEDPVEEEPPEPAPEEEPQTDDEPPADDPQTDPPPHDDGV